MGRCKYGDRAKEGGVVMECIWQLVTDQRGLGWGHLFTEPHSHVCWGWPFHTSWSGLFMYPSWNCYILLSLLVSSLGWVTSERMFMEGLQRGWGRAGGRPCPRGRGEVIRTWMRLKEGDTGAVGEGGKWWHEVLDWMKKWDYRGFPSISE